MKGFQWNFQILFSRMWSSAWHFLFLNQTTQSKVISPWLSKIRPNFFVWLTTSTFIISMSNLYLIRAYMLRFEVLLFPRCYSTMLESILQGLDSLEFRTSWMDYYTPTGCVIFISKFFFFFFFFFFLNNLISSILWFILNFHIVASRWRKNEEQDSSLKVFHVHPLSIQINSKSGWSQKS